MATINGETVDAGGRTILRYIQETGYGEKQVVVERNLRIIPREEWARTVIEESDSVEILQFVGGG